MCAMLSSVDVSGMRAGLDGGVLGRQAERVPAERVQHVEAAHPLHARHHVADDVVADVPDVRVAGRIREHLQAVELRPRRIDRRPRTRASAVHCCCHFLSSCCGLYSVMALAILRCRSEPGRAPAPSWPAYRGRARVLPERSAFCAAPVRAPDGVTRACGERRASAGGTRRSRASGHAAGPERSGQGRLRRHTQRLGERAQVVAAFGHEHHPPAAALLRHRAAAPSSSPRTRRSVSRMPPSGSRSCASKPADTSSRSGLNWRSTGSTTLVEHQPVVLVDRADLERHVDGEARARARADLVGRAGARVERILVRRDVQHVRIALEDVLRAVAVVDVVVDDRHARRRRASARARRPRRRC